MRGSLTVNLNFLTFFGCLGIECVLRVAMLYYLFGLCRDRQIAEDLSQELWAAVHTYFEVEQYEEKPLLYRKAKQVFIDYYRKIKRRPDLQFSEEDYDPVIMPERKESESAEEEQALFQEFWEMFYPDEYDELSKRIFWLHHRYGYKIKEVGKLVNLPSSTVHDKLSRLRERCRIRLTMNN